MAIVASYTAPCGAKVYLHDDAYASLTAEERTRRRTAANRRLLEIFANGYYKKQAECAAEYERRMKDEAGDQL